MTDEDAQARRKRWDEEVEEAKRSAPRFTNAHDVLEYCKIDHSHCWTHEKPPCGQRIEHLKCCLCEELNPQVLEIVARAIESFKAEQLAELKGE